MRNVMEELNMLRRFGVRPGTVSATSWQAHAASMGPLWRAFLRSGPRTDPRPPTARSGRGAP